MQAEIAWTESLRNRLENGDLLWIEEWLAGTTPSNRTEEDSE